MTAVFEVLSSSTPSQGRQTGRHWLRETRVFECGAEVGVERKDPSPKDAGWGAASGRAESAPTGDVTGQPSSEHSRRRRSPHVLGADSPAYHGGWPGSGSCLCECCSPSFVLFFLSVPDFLSSVASTLPLCLPDFAGRARARGSP